MGKGGRKFLKNLINGGGGGGGGLNKQGGFGVENFRGHLIREKKRMLEATAGYITVWETQKKYIKQRKHARMGTMNLIFKILW